MTPDAALGRTRGRSDAAYTLLYSRLEGVDGEGDGDGVEEGGGGAADRPPLPAWKELPAALRATVRADNEAFHRERPGGAATV